MNAGGWPAVGAEDLLYLDDAFDIAPGRQITDVAPCPEVIEYS
jgi:hypothetical protein